MKNFKKILRKIPYALFCIIVFALLFLIALFMSDIISLIITNGNENMNLNSIKILIFLYICYQILFKFNNKLSEAFDIKLNLMPFLQFLFGNALLCLTIFIVYDNFFFKFIPQDLYEIYILTKEPFLSMFATIYILFMISFARKSYKGSKKDSKNETKEENIKAEIQKNFPAQILEKVQLWHQNGGDFKIYEMLKMNIKRYYEKSFEYNFSLDENDLEKIFLLLLDDANSRLYKTEKNIDIVYQNLFEDIKISDLPFVDLLDEHLNTWIYMQKLLFKSLNLEPQNSDLVMEKFNELFKTNYIAKISAVALSNQKKEYADRIFFDLIAEAVREANYNLAEFDMEKLNKEARVQLVFSIKNSENAELLKEYININSILMKDMNKWYIKQKHFFGDNKLLDNTKDEFFEIVLEHFASHPYDIYTLPDKNSKAIFKEFLKQSLEKTGYVTKKFPETDGLILMENEIYPVFLQSFIYHTKAWSATYEQNAITPEEKDKIFAVNKTLRSAIVDVMSNYKSQWLLKKDGSWGEMLFYQLLPIALSKI